jgi:hypothetical protein
MAWKNRNRRVLQKATILALSEFARCGQQSEDDGQQYHQNDWKMSPPSGNTILTRLIGLSARSNRLVRISSRIRAGIANIRSQFERLTQRGSRRRAPRQMFNRSAMYQEHRPCSDPHASQRQKSQIYPQGATLLGYFRIIPQTPSN